MPVITHGNLKTNNGIHVAYSFSYADSAARSSASGLTANDVGKFALQQNDKSIWMLTNHSPVTWKLISLEAHAHVISDITNLQDVLDGKAATGHDHVISDITGLSTAISDLQGVNSAQDTAINSKAPINSPTFTGTVSGITKAMVGLGNVDNTSDTDKPVSSAVQTALNAKVNTSAIGAAEGVCPLDTGVKVATAYLPDAILGQVSYQGVWNASTNSPAIPAASAGNKGYYYICSTGVASSHGYANVPAVDFVVGDWIISSGASWSKVDNTDSISSFNGRTGAITPIASDYSAFFVTPSGSISGSSGSCTGNAASATTAASCTGNAATATAASGALVGDNSGASSPRYLVMAGSTGGTNQSLYGASSLNYVPSTGVLTAPALNGTAYKIRTSAPGSPTDGDIWIV